MVEKGTMDQYPIQPYIYMSWSNIPISPSKNILFRRDTYQIPSNKKNLDLFSKGISGLVSSSPFLVGDCDIEIHCNNSIARKTFVAQREREFKIFILLLYRVGAYTL